MNEEIQVISAELQSKLDDLALAQSDMKNLLNSTDIAILFLDQKLNIRHYTEKASKIINVQESDISRPLSDLTTSLQYPALRDVRTKHCVRWFFPRIRFQLVTVAGFRYALSLAVG